MDLYWASSSEEFFDLYASSVMRGSRSIARRAAHFMKNFLPRLRPRLSIDVDGNPELSLDLSAEDSARAAAEVFDLPEKIAGAEGKRYVVVLDEFQEIMQFGGPVLERQMRAAIQHHRHVSYLFAGSKTHMLIDMIADETRPFYQMGTLMSLDKIPEDDFSNFITAKFDKSGRKISPEAVRFILQICENVPHYVQLLCFNLWDHFQKTPRLTEKHVQQALVNTLRSQEPAYLMLWERLTLHQRKTLKAVAALRGRLLTAKDSMRIYNLESASNVAKSLKAMPMSSRRSFSAAGQKPSYRNKKNRKLLIFCLSNLQTTKKRKKGGHPKYRMSPLFARPSRSAFKRHCNRTIRLKITKIF
jgi:hypothetical protein